MRSSPGRSPRRIELLQELCTTLGLVVFADFACHLSEAAKRTKKAMVRRLGPPHVARTPPSARPQRVEPPVVADAVCRIALDRVASEIAEFGPAGEEPRGRCDHQRDSIAPGTLAIVPLPRATVPTPFDIAIVVPRAAGIASVTNDREVTNANSNPVRKIRMPTTPTQRLSSAVAMINWPTKSTAMPEIVLRNLPMRSANPADPADASNSIAP